jgi:hypothetical protein
MAAERAGHEVALDLCRHCMRQTLRAVLGIRRRALVPTSAVAPLTPPARVPRHDTVCSLAEAEAFISACCARLDALHRGELPEPDGCIERLPVGQ